MGLLTTVAILIILFSIFAVYFTLNFIEHLYKNDERIAKQSKLWAIICFGITIVVSVVFGYLLLVFYLL